MATLILLNKPFQVLSQFKDDSGRQTLAEYVKTKQVYPAGRLDYDSEGLLLLTDHGGLQHRIAHPDQKLAKTYWVQVEGVISENSLAQLRSGVKLKDGVTKPAKANLIDEPEKLWPRNPPIRDRANIPTQWLELSISEGKNRQVRRMTAAVGHPTLRLIRAQIGPWHLDDLLPGESLCIEVPMPETTEAKVAPSKHRSDRHKNSRKRQNPPRGSRANKNSPSQGNSKPRGPQR